ncbi:MAG: 4-hydroxy-tetrahydrodipicolinate synthase [Hoeflea sp.]|uniref:4-hydroxy-tetrahydrodipicolinate synthase n=1 Tax=Hoeflea sp. TaxID=1940281 RepID=UPI001DAA3C85|nr:4-hydroxy-tetrahydrodipicolinate synthase [Hoeflea sp.]MBU4531940.1 4-hydroxy-tetrahydrodipicolinate synthase [Alphaproteobacteria bacterium]MBU4546362.1 4-hydroxy-tetrahydrodipicolinate synthase [Alphaproteobacteria bacterium]MBU4549491.1 4-hydroxy-tetrahydrodipicolinate synthase [Alphaproteobacteria bacterium]MBV1722666.1 4-hydroxy-tetrahydrodipicolinate synthase [Hoeflea sp.]MBV1782604.1 4-hydroxy-tetrahydrodipicolinate synthase [Hoeflea sp.]
MNELARQFNGVFTALITPFKDGAVDTVAFDALVERQLAAGITGLVPVGTTGEAATLSDEEADALIARTVRLAAGRALVMAGAGANDTKKTIEKVRRAEAAGADAVLIVTPYYNKPTQAGLVAHYSAAAEATSLPVMLYSVPGRCGVEIAPETCALLIQKHANIVGIKEAGGSAGRVTQLRAACGDRLIIHSGDDGLTLPFLSLGALGVTSVVANVAPGEMVKLVEAWKRGDAAQALMLHELIAELTEGMFIESNPGPVKAALAIANLAGPEMRLPMVPVSAANRERLSDILGRFTSASATFQERC